MKQNTFTHENVAVFATRKIKLESQSTTNKMLPAATLARLAAGSRNGLPNTLRFMCSFELLMIGGKPV